jgi:hypothetical protein
MMLERRLNPLEGRLPAELERVEIRILRGDADGNEKEARRIVVDPVRRRVIQARDFHRSEGHA